MPFDDLFYRLRDLHNSTQFTDLLSHLISIIMHNSIVLLKVCACGEFKCIRVANYGFIVGCVGHLGSTRRSFYSNRSHIVL